MMLLPPRVSVIIPLPDHRGQAEVAIRSWTQEQTLPRHEYEIVVATDGREEEVESAVTALMSPHDRLVRAPHASLQACYNAGALAARGQILFFTESHVKAAPDCLEQLVERLARGDADGVAIASGGIDENRFAGQEQLMYEDALPGRIAGGWNLCTIRGFAVRRVAYERVGGFQEAYGHFAELLLGAALKHAGFRLEYAPLVRVWHFNSAKVAHFARELNAFGRDEIRFRAENPDSPLLRYLGPCPVWQERGSFRRGPAIRRTARALRTVLTKFAAGDLKAAGRALEESFRIAPCVLWGPAWPAIKAAAAVWCALIMLRLFYFSDQAYFRAFQAMWNGQIRLGRATEVLAILKGKTPAREAEARESTALRPRIAA